MYVFEKPIRRNLPPYSRFARPSQHFAAYGRELQAQADVVAKTADRNLVCSSGMLAIDQLRECRKIPDRAVLARDRMLPTFRDIWNFLPVDTDSDLKRLSLLPMNDQRIGALVRDCVKLTGFDAGNVHPGL